jgi:hypothetical protein
MAKDPIFASKNYDMQLPTRDLITYFSKRGNEFESGCSLWLACKDNA